MLNFCYAFRAPKFDLKMPGVFIPERQQVLTQSFSGAKMKKYLYGTTSLVGVGLLAGASPAQAESQPIHLELGGFFHQWQGIVDTDHCQKGGRKSDCNDADILQVGEIFFKIRGELDNGLEVGGRIELETQQDSDVIDAARVDISGAFGHVQLGQEDSARHNWA